MPPNKTYLVELLPSAQKEIDNLPTKIRSRVINRIIPLQEKSRPENCVKLKGSSNIFRLRVGDYRILYRIHDSDKRVVIVRVAHRKEAYR